MKFGHRSLLVVLAIAAPHLARAEGPPNGYPPPAYPPPAYPQQQPPPGYPVQPAQPPLYTAPLSQTTQGTYVPQSVALSGPAEIRDYDENRPPPPGYTPVTRVRKGLIIGGATTLGATYLLCALVASIGDDLNDGGGNEVAALWIPVLGPFVQMGSTSSSSAKLTLAVLGGAQVAGAVMLVTGITRPRTVLVRNDLVSIEVAPVVGPGTAGVVLGGTFRGL